MGVKTTQIEKEAKVKLLSGNRPETQKKGKRGARVDATKGKK